SEIAKKVEERIKDKWQEIAEKAKELLKEEAKIPVNEKLWNQQISNAIEIVSTWLEFFSFNTFNNVKDELPNDLKKMQEEWLKFVGEAEKRTNYGHFYALTYELLGIILTQKSRLWKAWEEKPITDKKCLMCGRRNALIENSLREGYRYWNGEKWNKASISDQLKHTLALKRGERLCAVCLVKRLYRRGIFKKLFSLKDEYLPKPESTVDIAGRDFINNVKGDEDFHLLKLVDIELIYPHEWESEEKRESSIKELENLGVKERIYKKLSEWWNTYKEPNKYYDILMKDGDRIGKWLSGERWKEDCEEKGLPNFEEFLHPAFREKIKEWRENGKKKGEELIKTKRILTSSHHIAISRAMKDFSLYKVPEIVEKFDGFLVYAGGDDVLALFPTDKVLDAAYEIQKYFKKDFYEANINGKKRRITGLGNKASMSAGIVFAHYKWPLYDVIEKVREAEKEAKNKYRRDAFCITFIKRSGEILTAGGKWEFKERFDEIMRMLSPSDEKRRKLSHRFVYDLLDVFRVLKREEGWEESYISILKAEVKRLLKKKRYENRLTEEDTKKLFEETFSPLIDEYMKKKLSLEDMGIMLNILYDAYRGEER
ncbi:MAG: type III-B CRISPR-associated protein Cas10/Cmr2, partial [Thaumarchaeota archaeon]